MRVKEQSISPKITGVCGANLVCGRGSAENVKSPIFLNMNIESEKDIVITIIKKRIRRYYYG